MIQFPRSLARQLRAVLRKSAFLHPGCKPSPLVFRAGAEGLQIQAHSDDVTVEYYLPGTQDSEVLAMPANSLSDFEGRDSSPVELGSVNTGGTLASWNDGVMPQMLHYEDFDLKSVPEMPPLPRTMVPLSPGFLAALHDASQVTGERGHFAVDSILLDGKSCKIIATDRRQLLIQSGFFFPWKDEAIIPSMPVFGCRELAVDLPIDIGRSNNFVTLQVGPWTFHLAIQKDCKFPKVETLLPSGEPPTVLRFAGSDVDFLFKTLSRLPGKGDDYSPITVDANGQLLVRAKADNQNRVTEVVLSQSQTVGTPVTMATNRHYLARALRLGFDELLVFAPEAPLYCRKGKRQYLWQPLPKNCAIAAAADAVRVESSGASPNPQRRKPVTAKNDSLPNGQDLPGAENNASAEGASPTRHASNENVAADVESKPASSNGNGNDLIAEVDSLKALLQEVCKRVNQIGVALKRQRKQAQIVQTTLSQLRQLQHVG